MQPGAEWLIAGVAAVIAGAINAVAGGGTLVSFPTLLALGVPPVSANITNTVALCPGYLGGAIAQRSELVGQRDRVRRLLVAAAAGGLGGSILLVLTSDKVFRELVPWLILLATFLLAFQDRIRRWLPSGSSAGESAPYPNHTDPAWLPLPVFLTAIYGGYFGAGLGIMLLAVLGLALHERLNRLNALKQVLALVINVVAALFFVFTGKVYWGFAVVMAVGSLLGGNLGGRLAHRLDPQVLRAVVVVFGTAVGVYYLVT